MKVIDLSVTIIDGLPVDPSFQIPHIYYSTHDDPECFEGMRVFFPTLTQDDLPGGHCWAVERLDISTHAGTHMDAPWHYHPTMNNGEPAWSIDQVPLEWCMGDGVMVDFSDKPNGYVCTSRDFIEYFQKVNYSLKPNDIVLVRTSAPTEWGSPKYLTTGCGVGREGTLWLCEQGIRTVGTDAWSWDAPLSLVSKVFEKTKDPSIIWEGHKAGMEKAYVQLEKLTNLDKLPPFGFKFIGLPIKIERASAGWVRAIALIDEN